MEFVEVECCFKSVCSSWFVVEVLIDCGCIRVSNYKNSFGFLLGLGLGCWLLFVLDPVVYQLVYYGVLLFYYVGEVCNFFFVFGYLLLVYISWLWSVG